MSVSIERHGDQFVLSVEITPGAGEWRMLRSVADKYGLFLKSDDGDLYLLVGHLSLDQVLEIAERWAESVRMCDIGEQISDILNDLEPPR